MDNEKRFDLIEHRLEKHGEEIDMLREDRVELKTILDRLDNTVKALEDTVKKLEMKPAKKYESIVDKLAYGAVAAAIVYGILYFLTNAQ